MAEIKNTGIPNAWGDGYQQQIVKDNSSKVYPGNVSLGKGILGLLILALITIAGFAFTFIVVPWFFITVLS